MKSIRIPTILLGLISASILISCSKEYPDGGLRKDAEDNLITEWSMEKATKNGSDITKVTANDQIGEVTEDWKFNSDGTCFTEDGTIQLNGTWKLFRSNKKLEVSITSPSDRTSTEVYIIEKLTSGSDGIMEWTQEINDDSYWYKLVSSR